MRFLAIRDIVRTLGTCPGEIEYDADVEKLSRGTHTSEQTGIDGVPRGEERTTMEPRGQQRYEGWTRRRTVAGAGAAMIAAGIGALRPGARAGAQIIRTGGGIAGGGEVKEKGSRAHFSVFASRFEGD